MGGGGGQWGALRAPHGRGAPGQASQETSGRPGNFLCGGHQLGTPGIAKASWPLGAAMGPCVSPGRGPRTLQLFLKTVRTNDHY